MSIGTICLEMKRKDKPSEQYTRKDKEDKMKTFKQFILESADEEYEQEGEEVKEKEEEGEEETEDSSPGVMDTVLDVAQGGLAAAGVADQTGVSDGINTAISLTRGLFSGDPGRKKEHYKNAALFGVSMIPGIGDAAKAGVYGPKMAKIMANPNVAKIMQSKGLVQIAGNAGTAARGRVSGTTEY